jgi:hypothetical protein
MSALAAPRDTPADARAAVRVFFQHWSPRLLVSAAIGWTAVRLVAGQWSVADLLVACCIVAFWPVQEWLIHVLVLHFKPRRVLGLRVDLANAYKHRAHHRDPWRVDLVFVPWFTVLPGLFVLPALAFGLLPTTQLSLTALMVYFVMSAHYEWVHYICHIRWCPPLDHYRVLVDSHRCHHFKSEKHWLGVSLLMGDRLLGTAPDPKSVEKSDTVRTLGVAQH